MQGDLETSPDLSWSQQRGPPKTMLRFLPSELLSGKRPKTTKKLEKERRVFHRVTPCVHI